MDAGLPALVGLRRALHRLPEPGFEERLTAGAVREELRPLGLELLPSPCPPPRSRCCAAGGPAGKAGARAGNPSTSP